MITISICMIVKNEQAVLARCLTCVKDIVDEIIIVDTGSTDSTKEIARRFTDNVYDFEWIDDFSAARNKAFAKATMDYVLWLDADDVILAQDIKKFIQFKKSMASTVDVVMMKYHVGFDEYGRVTLSYYRERLVKRTNHFKWCEPVHEYIQTSGNIINEDICITHQKEDHALSIRNLAIYEKILAQGNKLSTRGLYYYARELYFHEQYESAIQAFQAFLETAEGWVEDNISACFHLANCYKKTDDNKNVQKILLKSFEYDIPRAEICCMLGDYHIHLDDYIRAIFWYHLATQLKKPTDNWGFILHDYWGYMPNIQLCLCYDRIGDRAQAIFYNDRAASYKPNDRAVLYNKQYFDGLI
ncbi:MAG: glycosyltransferase family 2 protein [Hyphomonadaceae bacterium]|nr:glycosyltransferase family 2 protein [Clostridia bacterium]